MTPTQIFENAPIGAIIAWSDNTPRPPDRFKNKLSTWTTHNSRGRLIRKDPARTLGNYTSQPGFTLHEGEIGGVITILRTFGADSNLTFTILQHPAPGSVRIFDQPGERAELIHLAANREEAEAWLRTHRYRDAVLDEVPQDAAATDVNEGRAA